MRVLPFDIDRDVLAGFCRTNRIRSLAVFGSALGPNFGPASDIDLLVEFEPHEVPGLGFFRIQEELTSLFGRQVDLETAGFLSPHFRDEVITEAVILYDAA
jgi:predicted nucleotidyltransferase